MSSNVAADNTCLKRFGNSMSTIALIVPYFGAFPNYFHLFLESCRANCDIDFFVFTDNDPLLICWPSNVVSKRLSFEEFLARIQSSFDFPLVIETPYKLCDLRPAYGLIFAEELSGYDFWGYCDVDLIFGRIRHFLTDKILRQSDKIMRRGHLSLFPNTELHRNLFKSKLRNEAIYKKILSTRYNCAFDERFYTGWGGVNGIIKDLNLRLHDAPSSIADINVRYNKLHVNSDDKVCDSIFYFDGTLTRVMAMGELLHYKEYMYIHLQKRAMGLKTTSSEQFMIVPNSFVPFEKRRLVVGHIRAVNRWKFTRLEYIRIKAKGAIGRVARLKSLRDKTTAE